MTTKFDNFVAELKELCIKHQVVLDFGYEGCTVHNADNSDWFSAAGFWQDIGPGDGTEES